METNMSVNGHNSEVLEVEAAPDTQETAAPMPVVTADDLDALAKLEALGIPDAATGALLAKMRALLSAEPSKLTEPESAKPPPDGAHSAPAEPKLHSLEWFTAVIENNEDNAAQKLAEYHQVLGAINMLKAQRDAVLAETTKG
jgi:hypothetical protein